jgi:hypothetical protein
MQRPVTILVFLSIIKNYFDKHKQACARVFRSVGTQTGDETQTRDQELVLKSRQGCRIACPRRMDGVAILITAIYRAPSGVSCF